MTRPALITKRPLSLPPVALPESHDTGEASLGVHDYISFSQALRFLDIPLDDLRKIIKEKKLSTNNGRYNERGTINVKQLEQLRPNLTGQSYISYTQWLQTKGLTRTSKCSQCNATFTKHVRTQKFCSKECQKKYNTNRYHRLKTFVPNTQV